MTLVSALLAGLAAALLLSPPGRSPASARERLTAAVRRHAAAGGGGVPLWVAAGSAAALVGLVLAVDGADVVLGAILLGAVLAVLRLLRAGRRRRAAVHLEERVLEVCEALAGELGAGQPPVRALQRCADVWPELSPVATAAELGADVPAALRALAGRPGAAALLPVAAAWQVAQESGGGLAAALARAVDSAREARATRRIVTGELASAQATAHMVALLPVGVLLMGSGIGDDPWSFLLDTPVGLACLATGLALTFLGLWWIERIAAAVTAR